ncbi:putative ankyrin repeat protein [Rosellinia necatrix]|uniref:Putative ankyrin repeat protein n=1 Tax=Rosellinia necatrix TaxID=77044 RepID=A0A1S8A4T8_ROSNE|nr:putative ankyrin repeat protein [Rosellinia necatrix]
MDPLSVIASVAGIISLADTVSGRIITFCKLVKTAEKDIADLGRETRALAGALKSLEILANNLKDIDDWNSDSNMKEYHIHHVTDCKTTLEDLLTLFNKVQGGKTRRVRMAISSGDVQNMRAKIAHHHQNINIALSATSIKMLLDNLSRSKDMDTKVSDVMNEAEAIKEIVIRIQQDESRRKVLESFLKCNPQQNYDTSRRLRYPTTGSWLTQLPLFNTWLSSPGSKIWFKGIPGAGKTVLAASIIEAALGASSDTVSTAFFFCDYKDENTQSAANILSTILYQLALQNEAAYDVLKEFYDQFHTPTSLERTPSISDVQGKLDTVVKLFKSVFLIVDGLDECGRQTNEVVRTLSELAKSSDTLTVAFLSRDEIDVRGYLDQDFIGIEISAKTDDIRTFVTAEIEKRIRNHMLCFTNESMTEDIINGLVEGANGMFRWVTCQLDHLCACTTNQECREALNKLPPTLNETYVRILQRVESKNIPVAQMILHFIAYAEPKLTIRQLSEALAAKEHPGNNALDENIVHENTIVRLCSSLIRKSSDGKRFEFAHASVQEFLESTELFALEPFHISKSRCDQLLAIQCLRFLQAKNFDPGSNPTETTISQLEDTIERWDFYVYAAVKWAVYARCNLSHDQVLELALSLFNPKKTWIFLLWANTWHHNTFINSAEFVETHDESFFLQIGNWITHKDFTPLHLAAAMSLPEICIALMQRKLDPDLKGPLGTALECAVEIPHLIIKSNPGQPHEIHARSFPDLGYVVKTIDCLLKGGANMLAIGESEAAPGSSLVGRTFFMMEQNQVYTLEVVQALLSRGVELTPNDLDWFRNLMKTCDDIATDLLEEPLEPFLVEFLNPMIQNVPKSSLLFQLCSMAWLQAITWGLNFVRRDGVSMDTRISIPTEVVNKSIILAVSESRLEDVKILLNDPRIKPAEITDIEGRTLLHMALRVRLYRKKDHLEIFETLLGAGCNALKTNKDGAQPVHVWDWRDEGRDGCEAVVKRLVALGMTCASQDNAGRNALHLHSGSLAKLAAFVKFGERSDVDLALTTRDIDGYTPIARAIDKGHTLSAEFLLDQVGQCPQALQSRVSLLALAVSKKNTEVFERLLRTESLKSQIQVEGVTYLHHIAADSTVEFAKKLKLLFPGTCETQHEEMLPLSAYLEKCIEEEKCLVRGMMAELCPKLTNMDLGNQIWSHFTTSIIALASEKTKKIQEAIRLTDKKGEDTTECRQRYQNVLSTLERMSRSLIDLGVVRCFEEATGKSAIFPLLDPFDHFEILDKISPISAGMIRDILNGTQYLKELRESVLFISLFHACIRSANILAVNSMLRSGADVHKWYRGFSALHVACKTSVDTDEKKAVFKLLLESADPSRLDEGYQQHYTPLQYLRFPGDKWAIKEVMNKARTARNSVNLGFFSSALCHHVKQRNEDLAIALLENGADPTEMGADELNAIQWASYNGPALFLAEAYKDKYSRWGIPWNGTFTADRRDQPDRINLLHAAALGGSIDCMKFYLSRDSPIDINAPSALGLTPLYHAAQWGRSDAIKYLLGQGANADVRAHDGTTPLDAAIKNGHRQTAEILTHHGHMASAASLYPSAPQPRPLSPADTSSQQGHGSGSGQDRTSPVDLPLRIKRVQSNTVGEDERRTKMMKFTPE